MSRHVGSRATQAQLGWGGQGRLLKGGTEFGGVRLHQEKSKRKGIHAGGTTRGSEWGPGNYRSVRFVRSERRGWRDQ